MSLRVIWQYMDRSIYCHMTLSATKYLLCIALQVVPTSCVRYDISSKKQRNETIVFTPSYWWDPYCSSF